FRYGWSATTDALALALQSAALYALLARPERWAGVCAGLLAGLACLTRYNAGVLLPAGVLIALLGGAPSGRKGTAAGCAAAFSALTLPWLALAAGRHAAAGGELFHNIAYEVYAHSRGLTWGDYQQTLQPRFHSLWDVIAADPGAVAGRVA